MIAYFNGEYLPHEQIAISPLDRGFIFGDALYEVLRAYNGHFLKLEQHIQRLEAGAREVRFSRTEFPELAHVARELIARNNLNDQSAVVYIQVTRGVAERGHGFPPEGTPLTVYVSAAPIESNLDAQENGVKTITVPDERWVRRDIKSTNRMANVLASAAAQEAGAYEALFVQDGSVLEGTHSSFFAVLDGQLVTHPKTSRVLPGTTVEILCDKLSPPLGIPTSFRSIRINELSHASEAFVTGTLTEITPVIQVNSVIIGDGYPGPVTKQLQEALRGFIANLPYETDDGGN
jgi:D-alanine transaminase